MCAEVSTVAPVDQISYLTSMTSARRRVNAAQFSKHAPTCSTPGAPSRPAMLTAVAEILPPVTGLLQKELRSAMLVSNTRPSILVAKALGDVVVRVAVAVVVVVAVCVEEVTVDVMPVNVVVSAGVVVAVIEVVVMVVVVAVADTVVEVVDNVEEGTTLPSSSVGASVGGSVGASVGTELTQVAVIAASRFALPA
mmetsp:Transcript_35249/g.101529  ORF Transcript_35249/g.101529 Transcript_35249/m.101529 type:complete len:195 (+) Transcript_35249:2887-3471(+)